MAKKPLSVETSSGGIIGLSDLNGMPLAEYAALSRTFSNVENYAYYDSAVYDGGSAITPRHKAGLFTKGLDENESVVNNPAQNYTKNKAHTNMLEGGEFDNSTTMLVECIGVDVFLPGDVSAVINNGMIENPGVVADATYSAANHLAAIRRQFNLTYKRADQPMLDGLLCEFPVPFTASGAFGASIGGFIQNGFSGVTWNKLHTLDVFESNDRFRFDIEPLADTFTPKTDFIVTVFVIGKRIRTLYR